MMPGTGRRLCHWLMLAGMMLWANYPVHAQADDWASYRLGEVTVQAPANWQVESQRKNREIKLKSPDGEYMLVAFWWFPDEPLLGYADNVSVKNVEVTNKPAILIYHKYPAYRSLQLVFDEARSDQYRFNITLQAASKDLSKGSRLFDAILSRLKYGADAAAAKPRSTAQLNLEKPSVPDATRASQVHFDEQGEFAVRFPASWQKNYAIRDGSHHLTLVAPDKRSIVLVVAFRPSGPGNVADLIEQYEDLYYGDFIESENIEHDKQISVGALKGHLLEVIGRIYRVDGITLAFAQGRSWFFKSRQSDHGYIIAFIHALDASATRKKELKDIVENLRVGDEASAMKAEAAGELSSLAQPMTVGDSLSDSGDATSPPPQAADLRRDAGASSGYVSGLDSRGPNYLSVRAGPGTKYREISRLKPDTRVAILDRRSHWYNVELTDGTRGWAFGKYISLYTEPQVAAPVSPIPSLPSADTIQSQQPVPSALVSPAAPRWTFYENARFGTLIEYPSGLFTALPPPENGDGQSFRSIDGAARFIVFGQFNVLERTVEQMMTEDLAGGLYGQVTYQRKWVDRYVLSGVRQGNVFYRKVMVAAATDTLHAFEIDYPPQQKATYDAITARMARSLRAPTATDIAAGPSKVDGAKPAETPPRSDSTPQPATNDLRAILRAEFLALRESIR